jgi:hypothetical protein
MSDPLNLHPPDHTNGKSQDSPNYPYEYGIQAGTIGPSVTYEILDKYRKENWGNAKTLLMAHGFTDFEANILLEAIVTIIRLG